MKTDARALSHVMLTELRKRGVAAVQSGESPTQVAAALGVNLGSLFRWRAQYRRGGWDRLDARKRGGRRPKLDGRALRWIYNTLTNKTPQQLKFPLALWTAAMVQTLIAERFKVQLSHSSVCRLLHQLGLSAQRPLWRAYQQNPEAVQRWLDTEYPAIRRQARRKGSTNLLRRRGRSTVGLPQRHDMGSARSDTDRIEHRRTVWRQPDLSDQRPGTVALHADQGTGHRCGVHRFSQAAAGKRGNADLRGRRRASDASGKVGGTVRGGTGGEAGFVLSTTLLARAEP